MPMEKTSREILLDLILELQDQNLQQGNRLLEQGNRIIQLEEDLRLQKACYEAAIRDLQNERKRGWK